MTTSRIRRGILAAALGISALVATTTGISPSASAAEEVKGYPAVQVTDLKTGKTVDLSLNNGGKLPTLAWFWAPH
jgi:hypothetical protein